MTITDAPAVRQARGGRDPNLVRLLVMLVFVFVLMTIAPARPVRHAGGLQLDDEAIPRVRHHGGRHEPDHDHRRHRPRRRRHGEPLRHRGRDVPHRHRPAGAAPEQVVPYLVVAVLLALATGLACGDVAGTPDLSVQYSRHPGHARHAAALHRDRLGITNGRPQSHLPLLYSKIGNTEFLHFFPCPSSSSS